MCVCVCEWVCFPESTAKHNILCKSIDASSHIFKCVCWSIRPCQLRRLLKIKQIAADDASSCPIWSVRLLPFSSKHPVCLSNTVVHVVSTPCLPTSTASLIETLSFFTPLHIAFFHEGRRLTTQCIMHMICILYP